MNHDLVLDTCAFLWLTVDPQQLSEPARSAIESARQPVISAISLTEIHRLLRRGTIALPGSPDDLDRWLCQALEHHAVACEPITSAIAHAAEMLPWHHKDPADRFIIATARVARCPVVTPDEIFPKYEIGVVW